MYSEFLSMVGKKENIPSYFAAALLSLFSVFILPLAILFGYLVSVTREAKKEFHKFTFSKLPLYLFEGFEWFAIVFLYSLPLFLPLLFFKVSFVLGLLFSIFALLYFFALLFFLPAIFYNFSVSSNFKSAFNFVDIYSLVKKDFKNYFLSWVFFTLLFVVLYFSSKISIFLFWPLLGFYLVLEATFFALFFNNLSENSKEPSQWPAL